MYYMNNKSKQDQAEHVNRIVIKSAKQPKT